LNKNQCGDTESGFEQMTGDLGVQVIKLVFALTRLGLSAKKNWHFASTHSFSKAKVEDIPVML
jgi:hypothetical protein